MAGAPPKGLKEGAGEQFRHGAEVLGRGLVGVLHQVSKARKRSSGAIVRERSPTGKERPHRSLVVAYGVIYRIVLSNIARAPIGREEVRVPVPQAGVRVLQR